MTTLTNSTLRRCATWLAGLAGIVFIGVALPATAAEMTRGVLDSAGNAHEVRAARWSDLGVAVPAGESGDTPVLHLSTWRADGTRETVVVPETANGALESSPAVAFDDAGKTLYIVWESRRGMHSDIKIASWDGSVWSPAVDLADTTFSLKLNPRVVVTHDRITVAGERGPVTQARTLVNVLWWEVGEDQSPRLATLFIENGVPAYDRIRLTDLGKLVADRTAFPPSEKPASATAFESPLLRRDRGNAVIAAFAHPATNAFVVARVAYPCDPSETPAPAPGSEAGPVHVFEPERGNIPDIGVIGRHPGNPSSHIGIPFETLVGPRGSVVQYWLEPDGRRITYSQSEGESWSAERTIALSDELSRDTVVGMLTRLTAER